MKLLFFILILISISLNQISVAQTSRVNRILIEDKSISEIKIYVKYFPEKDSSEVKFKLISIHKIDREQKQINYNLGNKNYFKLSYNERDKIVNRKKFNSDSIQIAYFKFFYDENENLIKSKGFESNETDSFKVMNPIFEFTFFYNEQGQLTEQIQIVNTNKELKLNKILITYDKEGRKLIVEDYELDKSSNNFHLIAKTNYEYFPKGENIKKKIIFYPNRNIKKIFKNEYVGDNLTKQEIWRNNDYLRTKFYLYEDDLLTEEHTISGNCNCLEHIKKYSYIKN